METLERILREHPFLREMDDDQIRFMAGCARNVAFAAGQFLHREGDQASVLYLLRSGQVALEVHAPGQGALQVDALRAGDLLGWSWLFPPHRWQLDARAVEAVRALAFDGTCLREKMEADQRFGYVLAKRLLYEMYQRLARVRLQRLDLYRTAP
jgi:CRP-like cAMP-binding protein